MDQAWKDHFKPWILERGREYQSHGKVLSLTHRGNEITAQVIGTERYEVAVRFSRGRPEKAACSCPYASGGKVCKHMAAVLFALEELDYVVEDDDEALSWTEALEALPPEILRLVLRDLAEEDEDLQDLLLRLQEHINL